MPTVVGATLAFAIAGAAVGFATGHVVTAAVHPQVPRALFHRRVGPMVVDGRMLPAVWPGAQGPRPCGRSHEWFSASLDWAQYEGGGPIDDHMPTASVSAPDSSVVAALPTYFQNDVKDPKVAMVIGHASSSVTLVRASFAGRSDAMRPVEGWFALVGFFDTGRIMVFATGGDGSITKLVVVPATRSQGLGDHCLAGPT